MRVKNLIRYGVSAGLVLVLLLVTGCAKTVVDKDASEPEGGFLIRLVVPDYAHHTESGGSRIISPDTAQLRLELDGQEYMEIPVSPATDTTITDHGAPVEWTGMIGGIPVRTYQVVSVHLVDAAGDIVTSGAAFGVEVTRDAYTPVTITCFVRSGSSEFLAADGPALSGAVSNGSMEFYKFYGYAGNDYTVTLTPTAGAPDTYVFLPSGVMADDGAGSYLTQYGGGSLAFNAGMTGMYVVGVYGYGDAAGYTVEVTSNATDPAQPYVQEGYVALRNEDWDAALTAFSTALAQNPSSPEAIIGYSFLSLADMLIDPRLTDMIANDLGIVGYPTSMNDVLSTNWLEQYIQTHEYHEGDQVYTYEHSVFLPQIQGQEQWDGFGADEFDDGSNDGIIDPYEKLAAFIHYFTTHNTGFNDVYHTLSEVLGERLGHAIAAAKSANDTMALTLTWDMAFDTPEQAYRSHWPPDPNATSGYMPDDVVIGKAELMAMAGFLESIRSMAYFMGAYDYSMLREDGTSYLDDIYDFFYDPDTGLVHAWEPTYPDENPAAVSFLDFLKPTPDAQDLLDAARASAVDSLTYVTDFYRAVRDRTDTDTPVYFLNADNPMIPYIGGPFHAATGPADVRSALSFMAAMGDQMVASVQTGTPAVIPSIDWSDYAAMDAYLASWPTAAEIDGVNVIGINPGVPFEQPASAVLDLTVAGEPVWYSLDTASNSFAPLTYAELGAVDPADQQTQYFLRMPAGLFSSIFPNETLPTDDPTTYLELEYLDWWDGTYGDGDPRTDNGQWDPDEDVNNVSLGVETDETSLGILGPIIDVANLDAYGDDPAAHYQTVESYTRQDVLNWFDSFTDAESPLAEYTDVANVAQLRATFDQEYSPGMYVVYFNMPWIPSYFVYRDGEDYYFEVPSEVVWHSVTAQGTLAENAHGNQIESTGSVWYSMPFPW